MSYKPGDWWVVCDQCGRKAYASKMTKRWDNLIVHADPAEGCFETRHPQEFVRGQKDQPKLPFTRPEPEEVEVDITYSSIVTDAAHDDIPAGTFDPDL